MMRALAVCILLASALVGSANARKLGGAPIIPISVVTAEGQTASVVSLGWQPVANAAEYFVYRDGRFVGAATAASLSFTDVRLSPNTTYIYDVYAHLGHNTLVYGGRTTATTIAGSPVTLVENFEAYTALDTASLGAGWFKAAQVTTDISVTTEQSRVPGGKSVKFDFPYSHWASGSSNHLRTQISLSQGTAPLFTAGESTLGTVFWVGFSTYLDPCCWQADTVNNNELIWQWHGQNRSPGNWSPPVALYINEAVQDISINQGDGTTNYACASLTPPGPTKILIGSSMPVADDLGKWVDWVLRINFDFTSGSVDVWKDGVLVASYTGRTIYHCDDEQEPLQGPYFGGVGPYKWGWGSYPTNVSRRLMYMDEIRIGDSTATCADVKPTGSPDCE